MDERGAAIQKLWHMPQCKVMYERHQPWRRFSAFFFFLLEDSGCPQRRGLGAGGERVRGLPGA